MTSSVRWNKTARKNIEMLQKLREEQGITRRQLSERIGVSEKLLAGYERGNYPSLSTYNKIAKELGWQSLDEDGRECALDIPEEIEQPNSIAHTFIEGKCYSIRSKNLVKTDKKIGYYVEEGCTFRYEGKQGIHHMFREVKGGWTRTYTDAQLIGRKIKEVKD